MSTKINGFRVGFTSEFALGYTTTLFHSKFLLSKRKPLSNIFLKYIKRSSDESS